MEDNTNKTSKKKRLFDSVKINFISILLSINALLLTIVIILTFTEKENKLSIYFESFLEFTYQCISIIVPFALIYLLLNKNCFKLKEDLKPNDVFRYAIIFIVFVMVIGGVLINSLSGFDGRGTFGDMFGAVNTLFSGLGFSGLIYTIFLQVEDSKAQRNEFKLQLEEQRQQFAKQRFDDKFFKLLDYLIKSGNSIKIKNPTIEPEHTFEYFNKIFQDGLVDAIKQNHYNTSFDIKELVIDEFSQLLSEKKFSAFDFVRSFVVILNYIDNEFLSEKEKLSYSEILTLYLSPDQSLFLSYYIMQKPHELLLKEIKPIIEKYHIFNKAVSAIYNVLLLEIITKSYSHLEIFQKVLKKSVNS